MRRQSILVVTVVVFVISSISQASWYLEFIAYSHTDNSLYRLLGPTLQSTKIGTLETETYPVTNNGGLVRASENSVYMTERFTDILYTVSLDDASMIASVQLDEDMQVNHRGLDISPEGILYGIFRGNVLRTVNPQTGITTFVANIDIPWIESIAFSTEGILYAGTDSGELYELNTNTGITSLIASTPIADIDALTFSPDGYLYATDALSTAADLYRINPLTGITTNLGSTGLTEVNGLLAIPESAIASFQGLGDLPGGSFVSEAHAISSDGLVVAGASYSISGREAFRWGNGIMSGIGDLAGDDFYSNALGISSDGFVLVGVSKSVLGYEAFRWQNDTMIGLGHLSGNTFESNAWDVSSDGSVIVGGSHSGSTNRFEAFLWSEGVMTGLGYLPGGGTDSHAHAVSDDGAIIVGYSDCTSGGEAFRWTEETGMVGLGYLTLGGSYSNAWDVSNNGSVIVGYSRNASSTDEAFRWTAETGMVGLGDLPGGIVYSQAYAVNGDGSVIVGVSDSYSGSEAFLWTISEGIASLKNKLQEDFGHNLEGWKLLEARGISQDGSTIVGIGINPDGDTEAWIATIPESFLLLLDPNGGESLTSGKAYPIKWSSAGYISEVLIEYTVDNGSSWVGVNPPNLGNNGLYNWLVPAIDSNQCLVRISDASDPNIVDDSDDVFTIKPPVAGYIVGWGNNEHDQCDVPKGNDFVFIAAGWTHSLALKSDGSLKAWGNNNDGQCDVPLGNGFIRIAGGENHSLALKFNGELMAWGNNDRYQCKVPVGVAFLDMSAGPSFSLGLTSAGYLMGWGYNIHGQVDVPPGNDFIDVAAGGRHGMALRANHSLIAWGDNSDNQCDVPIGHDFAAIAAGTDHSLALKLDGSIVAWGHNGFGECNVPDGNSFVDIAAGLHYSLALKSDGSLVGWGYNSVVQVGIPSGAKHVSIAGGGLHALALVHEPDIGGYIDWMDLIAFCERWLDEGCLDVNDWCGGADINRSSVVESVDYSWLVKYWGAIAPEPNAAGHPEPDDGASGVSITADLSWTAGGDTAAHGVYFGTNPTPDVNEFGGYQTATIFKPGTMATDTTYYWQVDEVGLGGETAGDVWSFTTSPVPGKAYNPSPSDSATDVSINANLSWTANFYTMSHDVYFGTNATPGAGEFKGNQTGTTFDPGTLYYETTYYWRIDSVGPGGTTTGVIWSFTTEAPPVPGQAGNPIPADMATDVGITTCLNWAAGANTESHDVYFGTNPIPDVNEFQGNQAATNFCPPKSLEYNTTYYWRIDEKNPYNTTTGDVWSFTTMQDPNLVGWWKFDETSGVIAYDSSGNGNHGQLVDGLGNGLVWVPGEGALNFDGSNNLSRAVVSTVGMSTTEGAIGFWVKLAEPQNRGDGRNGSGYFFGCDNGVKDKILLYMDNSNTELDVRIGDHTETNIITLGTLVWYHIALTWNSGSYVVYLNGIVMSVGAYDGLTTFPSTADIGNNGGSSKQSFHGLMGDVRVYDKSISGSDIQELYQEIAD